MKLRARAFKQRNYDRSGNYKVHLDVVDIETEEVLYIYCWVNHTDQDWLLDKKPLDLTDENIKEIRIIAKKPNRDEGYRLVCHLVKVIWRDEQ